MPQLMFGGAVLGAWVDWNWKDNCGKTPFYLALFMGRLNCGYHIMVPQTGLDLIDKKDSSSGLPRRRRSLRPSPQCRFYKRNVVYKVQRAHLLWYNETKALRCPDLNLSQWPHLLFRWRRLGEEGHILQGGVGTEPVQQEVVKVSKCELKLQVASSAATIAAAGEP